MDLCRGNRLFERTPEALDVIRVNHRVQPVVIVAEILRPMLDLPVLVTIGG
jgi:hypothetical protein